MVIEIPKFGIRTINSYRSDAVRLKLAQDERRASFYFDNDYFSTFPVAALAGEELEDITEEISAKEAADSLSDFKEYLALVNLQKGIITDNEELKKQYEKLKDKKFSVTRNALAKGLRIFTTGSYSSDKFEPEIIFKDEKHRYSHLERRLESLSGLENFMKDISGNANDKKFNEGTVVAGMLRLPNIGNIIKTGKLSEEHQKDGLQYLEEVRNLTNKHPHFFSQAMDWLHNIAKKEGIFIESEKSNVDESDIDTYAKFAEEANKICKDSAIDLNALSELLYKTKIRDNKTFMFDEGSIKTYVFEKKSFDDLAGSPYRQNVEAIRKILDKTKNGKDMGIFTLLQGPPGNGKTLLLSAVLDNLPENTRGVAFKNSDFGGAMDNIRDLAEIYPDLYFVGIFDDIDLHIKTRDITPAEVSAVLNLDSIYKHTKLPRNVIILGATNRAGFIDPALIERSGRVKYVFNFPKPNDDVRREVIQYYSQRKNIKVDVPPMVENTKDMSCDDIAFFFREAESDGIKVMSREFIQKQKKQINERKDLIRDSSDLYKRLYKESKEGERDQYVY